MTSREKYAKYVTKPNFKDEYPFLKELFALEIVKTEIKMNRPVYSGQALLDLGKTSMYKLHYEYMQPKCVSKLKYAIWKHGALCMR